MAIPGEFTWPTVGRTWWPLTSGREGSEQLRPGVGGEQSLQAKGPVAIGVVAQVAGVSDALVGGEGVLTRSGPGLGPQAPVGQLAVGLVLVLRRLDQLVGAVGVEGQHPGHLAGPLMGQLPGAEGVVQAGVLPHLVGQSQRAVRGRKGLPGSRGQPLGRRAGPVFSVAVGLGRPLGRQGLAEAPISVKPLRGAPGLRQRTHQ
jgi:hypothetical protein